MLLSANRNRKLGGDIKSFSIAPCGASRACWGICYARGCAFKPAVKNKWGENFRIADEVERSLSARLHFEDTIVNEIGEVCKYFRLHASGDFMGRKNYFLAWMNIARRLPGCRFLAFTKDYELVTLAKKAGMIPENFQIVVSHHPAYEDEFKKAREFFPAAYINVLTDEIDGMNRCAESCAECKLCWHMVPEAEVVFPYHGWAKNIGVDARTGKKV